LLLLLPVVVLPGAPAPLPAAPAGEEKKPAETADPLPDGARLRLGSGHFRHGAAVTRIYALADGKRLLTFAQDAKARVWDVATEKELFEIALAPQPYVQLVFSVSHDGKTLAGANALDRTIRVWSLADGKETIALGALPPNQGFLDLEYSSDGKLLVSSHADRTYRIWDPVAAKEVRQINVPLKVGPGVPNVAVGRVNFTPDGKGLAVLEDWAVRVLDAEDGKEVRWFGGHVGPVAAYVFSPDGKRMATVASDRAARVWDLATGKTTTKLPLPQAGAHDASFSGDGKVLAVACNDRSIHVFDVAAAKELSHFECGTGAAAPQLVLSLDGKTVFCSNGESVLHGFDSTTGKDLYPATGHPGGVQAVAWSPDGKRLATAGGPYDRSVIIWDAAAGKIVHQLPPLETYFYATHLQFNPDGKTLVSYGSDRTVRVWDLGEGKELSSFVTSPIQTQAFALSADGKLAAVACPDRTVRVWDVPAEKELHRLEMQPGAGPNNFFFGNLSFAGDNRTLTVYSVNERLTSRWDALTGKAVGSEVKAVSLPVPAAGQSAHSADGRSQVVLQGATVNLTEIVTGRVRQSFTLPAPPPPVPGAPARVFFSTSGAAVSPDGRTAATLTTDGVLHFWDCGTGKRLVERKGVPVNSRLAAFSPDGKTLATAGTDSGALLWDVPGPDAEGRLSTKDVTAETMAELWKDVSGEDASRAWQAILTLAAVPKEAVPFVQKQLKPTAAPEPKQIAKWIADLDSEAFQEREDATEAIVRAGKAAEEAVKKALDSKPSAEAKQRLEFILSKLSGNLGPNMEDVRATRAVEVLEKIGTPEARKVLEEVAKGADGHLTDEARSALARLKGR
jgi:WD40 repeat protein